MTLHRNIFTASETKNHAETDKTLSSKTTQWIKSHQQKRRVHTGLVSHGAPRQIHRVECHRRRLQETRVGLDPLHLRRHRERRDDHAQDQVDADEELVGGAAVRPGVEGEKQTDSRDGQSILEEGEE